jgi:hypothetical protein
VLVDEPLADHFRAFAALAERDGGTVYPAICRHVAEDDEVLAILDHAPLAQRRPLILLASVHDLLLAGAEHPLAAHYDTVASVRGVPFRPPASDVATDFADFCRLQRVELERLVATRTTQTNEVGRCTSLLPALCHIAAAYRAGTALSLLDLGTSAGLNLLFDDYAYIYYQDGGDRTVTAGPAGATVALECEARGDPAELPALRAPALAARVGLDLSPIDPRSADEARWLLACQWPENPARFGRLRSALANVATSDHPPRLERGDMIDDLARVAATIEGDEPLVVFHSWVAAYLDEAHQAALVTAVNALDRPARPVHHLYCESPVETPGLPTPPAPVPRDGPDLATALVHLGPGGALPVRLADTHPHGYWIRWWPLPAGSSDLRSGAPS